MIFVDVQSVGIYRGVDDVLTVSLYLRDCSHHYEEVTCLENALTFIRESVVMAPHSPAQAKIDASVTAIRKANKIAVAENAQKYIDGDADDILRREA